jgi:hypothetical protein
LNRYTYCFNNPIIYLDPSGYDGKKVIELMKNFFYGLFKEAINFHKPQESEVPIISSSGIPVFQDDSQFARFLGEKTFDTLAEVETVFDASLSVGDITVGYSYVYNSLDDWEGHYVHIGTGKSLSLFRQPISASVGYGIVLNAEEPEDYAGNFIDVSGNLFIGLDACTWPEGASALMVNVSTNPGVSGRFDNYILIKSEEGFNIYASTNVPYTDLEITYDSREE